MKAIIVPGVTDLNKGDQALVWESHRLVDDTQLYDEIYILNLGDTDHEKILLSQQSIDRGFNVIENILQHPRRGNHNDQEHVKESKFELLRQIKNASLDFISTKFLLKICNNLPLVKKIYSERTYNTVKQFSEADTIFVKGGGFIHAYGERTAPYLMWYFLFYVRLAQALNKKVVFLPNSFGPFNGLSVKTQVKSVFNKLDLIYAREHVSSESLGQLLQKEIPIEMDLGFFLTDTNQIKAEEVLKKYGISNNDKVIGITIRPWRFPGHSNPKFLYEKYINSIAELSKHIISKGYKVALCNQSLGPNSHEDDRNAIKDLLDILEDSQNVIWLNENLTCDVLKSVYSNFYLFVGTRFHSVIFSLTSLVPSIAIGYGGNKAKGIMGDFNLNEYVIQIEDVESSKLIKMFDNAVLNHENIRRKLQTNMSLVSNSRERIIKSIQELYK